METVLERMERLGTRENIDRFMLMQRWPYDAKVNYAAEKSWEFVDECSRRGLRCHASVGGLDSITLLVFLRRIGIDVPAVSASYLEDGSNRAVHRLLGVESVQPLSRGVSAGGAPLYWSKSEVIKQFGFPVISKEIAGKIELLQNPSPRNRTVRHAIITGETGAYGGNRKNTRMKLPQKWLELFGGADPEGAAMGYKAAPFKVSAKCCYYLKERPCDLWARDAHSVPFLGLMASEGGRREKSLKMNGCVYFGASTIRCAPFAIFDRQDILQLALDLAVPVPGIYGEIVRNDDGQLRTTGAQRTGCSMCGFGIHLEKRPHRFDMLRERNPREWDYLMNALTIDENGKEYGWGRVLDYIGVAWR